MCGFEPDEPEFCLIHGYDHMREQWGNPIAYCQACEDQVREDERIQSYRIVGCEACGTEGRVLVTMPGEWDPEDRGPCPVCDGTGGEIITTEPIEMEDLP